jgi:hypothetical protein
MKKLLLIAVVIFSANLIYGQNYKSAVGGRLGTPFAASYKTFLDDKAAIEVYASFRGYSNVGSYLGINGAYQIHSPITSVAGLSWYYGGGAGLGFWSFDNDFGTDESTTSILLSGYLGLEYTFDGTPISISADWVPTYYLNGYGSGFGSDSGALAIRYVLN